jgi:hypothetical protein
MKPQRFEKLLFSDDPLSAEDEQQMEAHMHAYPELAMLQKNWNALKPYLEAAEMAEPEAGFAGRWRARWAQEAARQTRRSALTMSVLCGALALIVLAIFFGPEVPTLVGAKRLLLEGLDRTIEWFALVQVLVRFAGALLAKMPPVWWSAIASLILTLPLAWAAFFRQLAPLKEQ